jgi:Chitobiase/beta-hexosaminidase C-terminal domain
LQSLWNLFPFCNFSVFIAASLRCLLPIALTLSATAIQAQRATEAPLGIAWQVQGSWQVDGRNAPILSGDVVMPGSLLQPADVGASHSIVVLLPDGQRILYECFTSQDCARGFRVPSLYRKPEPFAVEMMARIQAELFKESHDSSGPGSEGKPRLPRDEAVAELGTGNRVQVAGLAAHLDNGRYTYDLRRLDRASAPEFHLAFEKQGSSITLPIPSAGIYDLTIFDSLNTPRIDLFIVAVGPGQMASITKSFSEVKALMEDWNSDKEGWPVHELQRAYLQSLLGAKPQPGAKKNVALTGDPSPSGEMAANDSHRAGLTAEPTFTPRPGFYDGRTAVALRCDTPGATMHYTVDGSQPVNASPVYSAPIIVMGSGLTIKSFATVAGKKDSAVVTGSYRIRDGD